MTLSKQQSGKLSGVVIPLIVTEDRGRDNHPLGAPLVVIPWP
jgi:hypothetical protein